MRDCTTCRYYHYLASIDTHICKGPGAGEISAKEVENTAKHGCDAWEPRMGVAS